jgi:hypothetical protein
MIAEITEPTAVMMAAKTTGSELTNSIASSKPSPMPTASNSSYKQLWLRLHLLQLFA